MSTVVLNAFLSAGFQLEAVCTRVFDPIAAEIVLQLDKLKVSGVDAAISNAQQLLESIQSGHASSLPLMNPVHVAGLTAVYLSIVMGGMFLMSRLFAQPFKVKTFALLHNLFLLSLSAFMFLFIVKESFDRGYSWFGNPVDESPTGIRMSKLVWLFYFSKVFEFVDTFIMILKKNNRQVSFLHLYHHSSIFVIWWAVTLWAPGGDAYFSAALNSFIHVVMYGYYFCTAIGINQVRFIKKYITMMQITQFMCMMVQSIYDISMSYNSDKPKEHYPFELSVLLFFYMQSMLGLFGHFFLTTYQTKKVNVSKKNI